VSAAPVETITINRAEARQRLARRLYLSKYPGSEFAPREWSMPQHVNQEPYLRQADELLAIAAGEKED
jgi:hypothetical protein